jgi:hypothetical protein
MLLKLILFVLVPYAILLSTLLVRKAPRRKTAKPISRGWGNRLRILIIGATGGTGHELVRQALEQGHQVTALVRKPKKMKLEHPNLRVVQGNVRDYDSVENAMRGQSAVLCALGTKHFFYPSRVVSNGTANILRAMKTCNVPRLVCESSLGLGNSVGRLGAFYIFGGAAAATLHFLRQSPAGKINRRKRGRLGDRASWGADEWAGPRQISARA